MQQTGFRDENKVHARKYGIVRQTVGKVNEKRRKKKQDENEERTPPPSLALDLCNAVENEMLISANRRRVTQTTPRITR